MSDNVTQEQVVCPTCEGRGLVSTSQQCDRCNGSGRIDASGLQDGEAVSDTVAETAAPLAEDVTVPTPGEVVAPDATAAVPAADVSLADAPADPASGADSSTPSNPDETPDVEGDSSESEVNDGGQVDATSPVTDAPTDTVTQPTGDSATSPSEPTTSVGSADAGTADSAGPADSSADAGASADGVPVSQG